LDWANAVTVSCTATRKTNWADGGTVEERNHFPAIFCHHLLNDFIEHCHLTQQRVLKEEARTRRSKHLEKFTTLQKENHLKI
jgi:hypothetical protein